MARGFRDEDTHTFEGKIEHKSAKSYVVEFTLGGKYFVPFSQIVTIGDPDIDGNREFVVKDWWWNKKEDFAANG